ncbi:CubicO group peptidase (beta-lactamase class C family) [Bradyrhizobium ottawaense]
MARIETAGLGDAFDLGNDDAAGIMRCHGDGERFQRQRLLLHGEVAVGIACRGADDPDVDRERLVKQALFAA